MKGSISNTLSQWNLKGERAAEERGVQTVCEDSSVHVCEAISYYIFKLNKVSYKEGKSILWS